jgi:hypothetical protein
LIFSNQWNVLFRTRLTVPAFRLAQSAAQSQALSSDPRILFHNLTPHPALEPLPSSAGGDSNEEEQKSNEANYRHMLVESALAILLPTEDLENSCLRTLVTDVIAELVLGNSIGGKVCENWFIWTSLGKAISNVGSRPMNPPSSGPENQDSRSRLEKYGLLMGHAKGSARHRTGQHSRFSFAFWRVIQYMYITIATIRFIVVGLFATRAKTRRSYRIGRPPGIPPVKKSPASEVLPKSPDKPIPLIQARIFSLSATLIDLRYRMPWLAGMLSLVQHHLVDGTLSMLGGTDGMLDQ